MAVWSGRKIGVLLQQMTWLPQVTVHANRLPQMNWLIAFLVWLW